MIYFKIKMVLSLFIILFTLSCSDRFFRYDIPIQDFAEDLKSASPDFRQGWYDGCETGMSSGANQFYKMFYKSNKQDGWKIANSRDYKTAWNYAYWYCYRDEYVDHKTTIFGSFFGGFK